MCSVVSEEVYIVAKHWLLYLLVVLEIQRISDTLADCLLETFGYRPILHFKIIIHIPGTYLCYYGTGYDVWMHIGRLNWSKKIEGGVS